MISEEKQEFSSAWNEIAPKEESQEFDPSLFDLKPTMADRIEAGEGEKYAQVKIPSGDEMSGMSHADLYNLRDKFRPDDKSSHDAIAPFEHRAFAREIIKENPLMALPVAASVPTYTAAKAVGLWDGRSGASLEELKQGFIGIGEGVKDVLTGKK